jgi:hypothetical protein
MERNWPRSGCGGSGSGSNSDTTDSGSWVRLRVNNGMLHTVMLPNGDSSDIGGCQTPLSRKKMIMGADTLSHCRGFRLAARLG